MKAIYAPNSSVAWQLLMHPAIDVQCHNRKQHFKLFVMTHIHIHNSLKKTLLISLQTLLSPLMTLLTIINIALAASS